MTAITQKKSFDSPIVVKDLEDALKYVRIFEAYRAAYREAIKQLLPTNLNSCISVVLLYVGEEAIVVKHEAFVVPVKQGMVSFMARSHMIPYPQSVVYPPISNECHKFTFLSLCIQPSMSLTFKYPNSDVNMGKQKDQFIDNLKKAGFFIQAPK